MQQLRSSGRASSHRKGARGKRHSRPVLAAFAIIACLSALAACGQSPKPNNARTSGQSSVSSAQLTAEAAKVPVINAKAPAGGNGGATATGVTANSIATAALYNGLGGNQTSTYYAVKAYFDWINANGGIYGRKLEVSAQAVGADATLAASNCANDATSDFAAFLAINVDLGCAPTAQKSTSLTLFGSPFFDPQYQSMSNAYDISTATLSSLPVGGDKKLIQLQDPHAKTVVLVSQTLTGVSVFTSAVGKVWEEAGLRVLGTVVMPYNNVDMTPYALKVKSYHPDVVDLQSLPVQLGGPMMKAMAEEGVNAKIVTTSDYDPQWYQSAGAADSKGAYVVSDSIPYLDPPLWASLPEGALFYKWYLTASNGLAPDEHSALSWENAEYFVQALVKAGPDLTSAKLQAALKDVRANFDGGGFIPPGGPGININGCFTIKEATGNPPPNSWREVDPTDPTKFDCADSNQFVTIGG